MAMKAEKRSHTRREELVQGQLQRAKRVIRPIWPQFVFQTARPPLPFKIIEHGPPNGANTKSGGAIAIGWTDCSTAPLPGRNRGSGEKTASAPTPRWAIRNK